MRIINIFLLIVLIFSSCSRNPVTGKKELLFMSESQEIAMGKQYDPSVVAEFGLYSDPKLQAFIEEKGKQMASISHRPNLPYTFKILDSPVVNAFAVPGGPVYFTRGIMAHFNNEAEFAGVLGHEIGHITAKHGARQQSSQMLGQLGLIVGVIASETFRQFADLAQQSLAMLFMSHSRAHETESDKLGVDYSTKIGYNSFKMAGFFKTLEKLSGDGGRLPSFMSTHPDPGDRYNNVKALSAEAQKGMDPSLFKENRNSYLRLIDGLIYGEDPKQGFVENNIFYHPVLKFQYGIPQGWRTVNSPSQVQMAPADGKAVMIFTLAEGADLNTARNNAVRKNNFNVLESANVNVNGFPAIAMISEVKPAEQQQQQQQQQPNLKVLTYLIAYNNLIYKFHGVSTIQDFNAYINQFQSSMKSFRMLTDQSKIDRQPTTIRIVEASRSATLQQILNDFYMPQSKNNELALINGMNLTDNIERGTLIKIFAGYF